MRLKSLFAVTSLVFCLSSEHDECLSGLHNCDENALCFNMVGGHSCSCKPGYTGNGTVCKGKHCHVDSLICCVMLIQVPKQDIKNAVAVVKHVRRELTLHWKQIFLSSVSGSTIKSDTHKKTQLNLFSIIHQKINLYFWLTVSSRTGWSVKLRFKFSSKTVLWKIGYCKHEFRDGMYLSTFTQIPYSQ